MQKKGAASNHMLFSLSFSIFTVGSSFCVCVFIALSWTICYYHCGEEKNFVTIALQWISRNRELAKLCFSCVLCGKRLSRVYSVPILFPFSMRFFSRFIFLFGGRLLLHLIRVALLPFYSWCWIEESETSHFNSWFALTLDSTVCTFLSRPGRWKSNFTQTQTK